MAAAAQLSLTQLSSGNPLYEKYYRQVDTGNTGRVLASDAAVFLKKSGLPDLILGKIWDLADTDGKGILNKQEFFVALRLVACAQNGLEVSLSSLNLAVPPPRFVWELSDIDHDGMLDRDEFAVAMFLVYCALEKEPVPVSLPPALVPPSKRKTVSISRSVRLIPSSTSAKEPYHSLPPVGILPTKAPLRQWVVSPAEKAKYDEIFLKTDKDMDGFVSGLEVREIFLKTGLPSALLAHIWALCDTKDCGKLSKDQFALAFHLINQKLIKGIDPPHILTPDMIPPSDRATLQKNIIGSSPVADFSAIKELDTLNNEIVDLQREKNNVEQDLKEKEDTIKQRTSEVQDLQDEVQRENTNLQKLQAQKQQVQELLEGLDEQKAQLEEQLQEVRKKCAEEAQLISSLKAELTSQESQISTYEEELAKAREELSRLQQETAELEESVESGKAQLGPLQQHLQDSQQEISSMQMKLMEMKELENHNNQLNWCSSPHNILVNGATDYCSLSTSSSETANLNEHTEGQSNLESESIHQESPARSSPEIPPSGVTDENEVVTTVVKEKVCPEFNSDRHSKEEDPFNVESSSLTNPVADSNLDFFQSDPFVGNDPFKDDPFGKTDPFGGDPFKGSDPFASDCFFKQSATDPFATSSTDPFSAASNSSNTSVETLEHNDPFAPGGTAVVAASDLATDPFASVFGNESFEDGFADFSTLSKVNNEDPFSSATSSSISNMVITKNMLEETSIKNEDVPPALPPKIGTPTRPCPPPPGKRPINNLDSSDPFKLNDPFQPFPGNDSPKEKDPDMFCDPFTSSSTTTTTNKEADPSNFANFSAYPSEEDMIEWAKRESEREEEQRLARLNQQEQEDLELAIALSKSEISEA
ncbi:epidermal growth factor receptor substrate 15 isoform X3 [Physeter macrocephalus]|uniref:Epidermal growth factor receptor substrate 15 n=1 Tax=Physeter macrocephalus TaxID=9755 RepID=A0A455BMU8_PHYMC|nr:epidermal growth factor receptor substrate 15 isoform X3 [Physeter catodon]|eukprot:XP_028345206.1 epidermal growth factor receptor substrate 15 isoform X3 [Physeter catodon]